MGSGPYPTVIESLKGTLVYFVTKGPVAGYFPDGTELWQVEAQVSKGDGGDIRSMVFTFDTEEHAITFKRDINYQLEPTVLGEEE